MSDETNVKNEDSALQDEDALKEVAGGNGLKLVKSPCPKCGHENTAVECMGGKPFTCVKCGTKY